MIIIRLIIGLVCFVLFCPSVAQCKEIVILFTQSIQAYQEAADGLESSLKSKNFAGKKLFNDTIVYLTPKTTNMGKGELLSNIVERHPVLIIAIGTGALDLVSRIDSIPIVYAMVPGAESLIKGKVNITGVNTHVAEDVALQIIKDELPRVSRLGIIYNPEYNEKRVHRIRDVQKSLKVIARPAHTTTEVFPMLAAMRGQVDALWLIPDLTVVSPRTLEAFVHFSIDNRIPLITFNEHLLKYGATLAITPKAYNMGVEAGDLAAEILMGKSISKLPPRPSRQATVLVNRKIFKMIVPVDQVDHLQ